MHIKVSYWSCNRNYLLSHIKGGTEVVTEMHIKAGTEVETEMLIDGIACDIEVVTEILNKLILKL